MTLPELAVVLTEARRVGIAREKAALLVAAAWWKIQGLPIPGIEAWLAATWPPDSGVERLDLAAEPGAWRQAFLGELSAGRDVSRAAALAGVSRNVAYKTRYRDPAFASAWDAAVLEGRRRHRPIRASGSPIST